MMRFVLIFLTVFFFSAAESDASVATPGNATDGGYDREEGEGTETPGNVEVPDDAEAVSYTHLDVYKRQAL